MDSRQIYEHTKTSVGTRKYLDFHATFHNTHGTKDSDELWSESFSNESVGEIIDSCNQTGMPANVEIKLKTMPNEVLSTINFVVLPTLMDSNITDYQSANKLAYYASPEMIRQETEKAAAKQKRAFSTLVREHEEMIKEFIRAELLDLYFILYNGKTAPQETLDYIKNLTIVREKYNLDKFTSKNITPVKLYVEPKQTFEDALYSFAKTHATENRKNNNLAIVYGFNTNFVGLEKPQTPATIASYAKKLVELSYFRRKHDLELGFIEDYKAKKQKPYTDREPLVSMPNPDTSSFQPQ